MPPGLAETIGGPRCGASFGSATRKCSRWLWKSTFVESVVANTRCAMRKKRCMNRRYRLCARSLSLESERSNDVAFGISTYAWTPGTRTARVSGIPSRSDGVR